METNLFYITFGQDWKENLINSLNIYDVCRNWTVYQRKDGMGPFALAAMGKRVPVIGFGKNAKYMEFDFAAMFNESALLRETEGVARYFNEVIARVGAEPRVWKKGKLVELFLNLDPGFRKYLVISAMTDFLIDFYSQLSRQWFNWLGGDELPGRVSPVTIWSNYANYELGQIRADLENLAAMHVDSAVETFMDMENELALQCRICPAEARFMCAKCTARPYCSKDCARKDAEAHQPLCFKKAS